MGRETVRLKKYFYALRPALALYWLRTRADTPPMDIPGLCAGLELDRGIVALDRFIEAELAAAKNAAEPGDSTAPSLLEDANALFRDAVAAGS